MHERHKPSYPGHTRNVASGVSASRGGYPTVVRSVADPTAAALQNPACHPPLEGVSRQELLGEEMGQPTQCSRCLSGHRLRPFAAKHHETSRCCSWHPPKSKADHWPCSSVRQCSLRLQNWIVWLRFLLLQLKAAALPLLTLQTTTRNRSAAHIVRRARSKRSELGQRLVWNHLPSWFVTFDAPTASWGRGRPSPSSRLYCSPKRFQHSVTMPAEKRSSAQFGFFRAVRTARSWNNREDMRRAGSWSAGTTSHWNNGSWRVEPRRMQRCVNGLLAALSGQSRPCAKAPRRYPASCALAPTRTPRRWNEWIGKRGMMAVALAFMSYRCPWHRLGFRGDGAEVSC